MCRDHAVQRTVTKEGPNVGRLFWVCAKLKEDPKRCTFFEWDDDPSAGPSTITPDVDPSSGKCYKVGLMNE